MVKYRPILTDAGEGVGSPSTDTVNEALRRLHAALDAITGKSGEVRFDTGLAVKGPIYSQAIRRVYTSGDILDTDYVVLVDTRQGAVSMRLPPATERKGRVFVLKYAAGSNNITILPFGADTIDGASSLVVTVVSTTNRLVSDGTNWWAI